MLMKKLQFWDDNLLSMSLPWKGHILCDNKTWNKLERLFDSACKQHLGLFMYSHTRALELCIMFFQLLVELH